MADRSNGKGRKDSPTHIYRDAAGVIRFGKVRNPPGRESKAFWLHPDDNGGWAKGAARRPVKDRHEHYLSRRRGEEGDRRGPHHRLRRG